MSTHQSNYLLTRFIFWLLVWLVASFTVWYHTSAVLNVPLAVILGNLLVGEWISEVSPFGQFIEVVTNIPVDAGMLAFDLNPLIYTYNTAFFFALVLATPTVWRSKFNQLVIGWLLVLLPVQVLGLVVLTYKTLLIDFNTGLVTTGWQLDALVWAIS